MLLSIIAIISSLLIVSTFSAPTITRAQTSSQEPKLRDKPLTRKEIVELDRKGAKPPSAGTSFYVARVNQSQAFTVLLCSEQSTCDSGLFTPNQIESVEATIREATKFAQTEEEVGTKKPITTRLYDKNDPAFIVDVSKMGNQSHFFITMKTPTGRLTIDAGEIKRGDQTAKALIYDLAAKLAAVKTSPPAQ